MPRKAHHDEFEADLRHLMRSLNDAPALRRNGLARSLAFPGEDAQFVAALHDFVRSVLPARPPRGGDGLQRAPRILPRAL